VGRLAGGVAHDFSNILAVILGYSDLLLRDMTQADTRARESVQGIVEAANRAVGVTRQLLTVSRKKLVRPEILSVNKVVSDLMKLLGRAVGERIALTTTLAPDLWPVEADLDQLAQVLLNLAVNARDAMPNGGPLGIVTRNVKLEAPRAAGDAELAPGRWVTITVSDHGVGMSEEVRARIFEPFFTTKETGTGLGLATVYGIVRQAGGGVDVASRLGEGTVFTVYLPAAEARAQAAAPAVEPNGARGLGETVLLAEDEDALRVLIRRVLSGRGYRVIDAKDGRDALEAAKGYGGPIHLLLADLVMPRMSGQQLADALSADRPGVKVLFMTGHTEEGVLPAKVVQGQAVLLQKPFTGEALLGTVRRLLEPPAPRA
jgi:CheY-like chemotaxis protein